MVEALGSSLTSPWMTAEEAAAYLRCPTSRIRKLTATRELPCQRDGRRVLYHRDELDAANQSYRREQPRRRRHRADGGGLRGRDARQVDVPVPRFAAQSRSASASIRPNRS